jgi:hypothetical protein
MQKDKIRDMIRSVLPSTVKDSRTDRTYAHKSNRKKVKQTLHQYTNGDWEDEDEMVMRIHESDFTRRRNIRAMVRDRRRAAKINHFVHWCKKKTKHISEDEPQEKYYYISNLIESSGDLIRERALGYFIDPWEFNVVARGGYRRYGRSEPRPVLFTRDAFDKALIWCFEHCPGKLNQVLKGGKGGHHDPVLKWRACKDKDSCTSTRKVRQLLYSYQLSWGWHKTSWTLPWSYREGTLNSQMADRILEEHDEKNCVNKIIVYCREDLERISDKVFGWRGQEVYRESQYSRYRGDDSGKSRYDDQILERLMPLFINKNLLEDRRKIQ